MFVGFIAQGGIKGMEAPQKYQYGGRIEWRIGGPNGVLHRTNGPALEFPGCYEAWFSMGKRHRDRNDGPAVWSKAGMNQYWEFGSLILK